jgi:hypothetical protein
MTGDNGGWQEVVMDRTTYSRQGGGDLHRLCLGLGHTQGLGVFVDNITITGYAQASFETGMGRFEITTPPENTPFNNWIRMQSGGFAKGPVVRTPNSVFIGFGFEADNGVETRAMLMQRLMDYLLAD